MVFKRTLYFRNQFFCAFLFLLLTYPAFADSRPIGVSHDGTGISSALTLKNDLGLSFFNSKSNDLIYMCFGGTEWKRFVAAERIGSISDTALIIDGSNISIYYYDFVDQTLSVRYRTIYNPTWNVEVIDHNIGFSESDGVTLSAIQCTSGHCISYNSALRGGLALARGTFANWAIETVDGANAKRGVQSSLAVDSLGKLLIAYYGAHEGKLFFASGDSTGWLIDEISYGVHQFGFKPSLSINQNGEPIITSLVATKSIQPIFSYLGVYLSTRRNGIWSSFVLSNDRSGGEVYSSQSGVMFYRTFDNESQMFLRKTSILPNGLFAHYRLPLEKSIMSRSEFEVPFGDERMIIYQGVDFESSSILLQVGDTSVLGNGESAGCMETELSTTTSTLASTTTTFIEASTTTSSQPTTSTYSSTTTSTENPTTTTWSTTTSTLPTTTTVVQNTTIKESTTTTQVTTTTKPITTTTKIKATTTTTKKLATTTSTKKLSTTTTKKKSTTTTTKKSVTTTTKREVRLAPHRIILPSTTSSTTKTTLGF